MAAYEPNMHININAYLVPDQIKNADDLANELYDVVARRANNIALTMTAPEVPRPPLRIIRRGRGS